MPASNKTMIHKLQTAINTKGERLLVDRSQFYSDEQDRPITMYKISRSVFDEDKQRNTKERLFETTSQIQVVLYLRDYWCALNGEELPTDNEIWNDVKREKQITFNHVKAKCRDGNEGKQEE